MISWGGSPDRAEAADADAYPSHGTAAPITSAHGIQAQELPVNLGRDGRITTMSSIVSSRPPAISR